MNILLTNDDGIQARGIHAIYFALCEQGHSVQIVAPISQQSGVGQGLTVFEPVRAENYHEENYHGLAVYGTPADCVKLALGAIVKTPPDLVVSGINLGSNIGPDVLYSGTIAAAVEASLEGIPSMALSMNDFKAKDLSGQARHAARLASQIDWTKFKNRRVLNVNYPSCPMEETRGVRVCPLSTATWRNAYTERRDPRNNSYWWLDGELNPDEITKDSDCHLLREGYITVTPLLIDYTDRENLDFFRSINLS